MDVKAKNKRLIKGRYGRVERVCWANSLIAIMAEKEVKQNPGKSQIATYGAFLQ